MTWLFKNKKNTYVYLLNNKNENKVSFICVN